MGNESHADVHEEVNEQLLSRGQMSLADLEKGLATLYQGSIDYADIYLQSSHHESWVLEDGIVKSGSFSIDRGLGVRAIEGEKTGFAYADDISVNALGQTAQAARGIAAAGQSKTAAQLQAKPMRALYLPDNPLAAWKEAQKIDILQAVDRHARKLDNRISEVTVSLTAVYEHVMVVATDGTHAVDIRPLVRLNCSV